MADKTKIKAFLFDAGGILFDDMPSKFSFGDYVIQKTGNKDILGAGSAKFKKYKDMAQTRIDYSRERAYYDCLQEIGRTDLYEGYMGILKKQLEERLEPMPYATEVLGEIRRLGKKSYVVTDNFSPGEEFLRRMNNSGIRDLDGIVSSKEVGVKKPAKKIFDLTLKKIKLKKDEVVFVAHDLDEIKGASLLGYRTAAVYWNPKEEAEIRKYATYMVSDLRDLLKLIKK